MVVTMPINTKMTSGISTQAKGWLLRDPKSLLLSEVLVSDGSVDILVSWERG